MPTPPPTWTADAEPDRGYKLQYPPGWAPKAAATGGADHAYYASQDAPAPLEMSHTDVWLTVQVEPLRQGDACDTWLPGADGGSVPALLAGRPAQLKLRDPAPNAVEPTWKAYAATQAEGRCYTLWFVTLTKDTRTKALGTMLQILAGFSADPAAQPSPEPSPIPIASPSPPAAAGASP